MQKVKGFTLFEIAIAMVVMSILIVGLLSALEKITLSKRFSENQSRIETIETAVMLFVMQNQRLPCPADGRLRSGIDANAGVEMRDAVTGDCTSQQYGVVPFRALGIREAESLDSFGNRVTYRVALGLTKDSTMNLSRCDPAGASALVSLPPQNGFICDRSASCSSATVAACTSSANAVLGRGIQVKDSPTGTLLANPGAGTGAAFVLISHGQDGAGAYNIDGVLQEASIAQAGNGEKLNSAALTLDASTVLIDSTLNLDNSALHFDDLVVRPTILGVTKRAGLAPRAQP